MFNKKYIVMKRREDKVADAAFGFVLFGMISIVLILATFFKIEDLACQIIMFIVTMFCIVLAAIDYAKLQCLKLRKDE